MQQNWYDIAFKYANFKAVREWTISPNRWQYSKGSVSLQHRCHHPCIFRYLNTSSTGCPFRTIALGRGCLVVDEFTILMDLVLLSGLRVDFMSKRRLKNTFDINQFWKTYLWLCLCHNKDILKKNTIFKFCNCILWSNIIYSYFTFAWLKVQNW